MSDGQPTIAEFFDNYEFVAGFAKRRDTPQGKIPELFTIQQVVGQAYTEICALNAKIFDLECELKDARA